MTYEMPASVWEFKKFVAEGHLEAETPVEALIQAQILLLDEERWIKGHWYKNEHPEVDPDDPFCNDWKVCATGALLTVSVGNARKLMTPMLVSSKDVPSRPIWELKENKHSYWTYYYEDSNIPGNAPEGVELYKTALKFLLEGARKARKVDYRDVAEFNDAPFTTRTDVLRAYTYAIQLAVEAETETKVLDRVKSNIINAFATLTQET